MDSDKYYPGDALPFHFTKYREAKIKGKTIVVFDVVSIKFIQGTVADKKGVPWTYNSYKGEVRMRKEFILDKGFFGWANPPISINSFAIARNKKRPKKTRPFKPPQEGRFFPTSKSNLYLDINEKGQVWLTNKTFYEINLLAQRSKLTLVLHATLDQIKSIDEELQELEFDEGIRVSEKEKDAEEFDKIQDYYSNLQDELSEQEINRMNLESDGFFSVD